jgi:hypothetical protein
MPFEFSLDYLESIGELEHLSGFASDFLAKHGCSARKPYLERQGYALLERLSAEVHSLLGLIPGSKRFPKDAPEACDFPSFAVLARQILEDSVTFLYLVESGLLADQLEFRQLVWEYHSATEKSKIASLYGYVTDSVYPKGSPMPLLKKAAEEKIPLLKKRIEEHHRNAALPKYLREKVGKGKENLVAKTAEILTRLNIPAYFYDAPYTHLSNFVHASEFSLTQVFELSKPSKVAAAQFRLASTFVNFMFGTALSEAIRTFGGVRARENTKVNHILDRNRLILTKAHARASGQLEASASTR